MLTQVSQLQSQRQLSWVRLEILPIAGDRATVRTRRHRSGPLSWRRLAGLGLLSLALVVGLQAAYIFLGPNFRDVVPRRCYRSAQPTPERLALWTREFGLRTIINLRGKNTKFDWYQDEVDAAKRLGLTHLDVVISGKHQPTPELLRSLVDALDRAAEPILIHCGSGIDRTGLASACYLLLRSDATLQQALGQLDWQLGYFPVGQAAQPLNVVLQYRAWLRDGQRAHTPDEFRRWVQEAYVKED